MKTNLMRIIALSTLAAAAGYAQQNVDPQTNGRRLAGGDRIVGLWDVAVTVVNCQTGAVLRNVHSVQLYQRDGAFSETASLGTRGSSIGVWNHEEAHLYTANYYFFRYKTDLTFASFAKAVNNITLSPDGNQFTVTATIQDYDADNNLLSTGCVTQTGTRL